VIMRAVTVPLSFGEAADKITILAIKRERMTDAEQLAHVRFGLFPLLIKFRDAVFQLVNCFAPSISRLALTIFH